jgi:Asp-tRNA(Asn)/Glu-tRNA(Gln) amidotransferase A subunit family amidase
MLERAQHQTDIDAWTRLGNPFTCDMAKMDNRECSVCSRPRAPTAMSSCTPDAAPKGLQTTGDPRYIAPWTAIGGPLVTIPAGVGANRLPHACMLAGHPGRDHDMATYARRFAADCEVSPFPT